MKSVSRNVLCIILQLINRILIPCFICIDVERFTLSLFLAILFLGARSFLSKPFIRLKSTPPKKKAMAHTGTNEVSVILNQSKEY